MAEFFVLPNFLNSSNYCQIALQNSNTNLRVYFFFCEMKVRIFICIYSSLSCYLYVLIFPDGCYYLNVTFFIIRILEYPKEFAGLRGMHITIGASSHLAIKFVSIISKIFKTNITNTIHQSLLIMSNTLTLNIAYKCI